jgi:hypothetical protein
VNPSLVRLTKSQGQLPALVALAGERASMRFLEFFAANIRNPHTRRAYARAAQEFLPGAPMPACRRSAPSDRCTSRLGSRPRRASAAPSVKQRVAAIRHLFDWLVTGQVVPVNPVGSARAGHVMWSSAGKRRCSTPPRRALLDSIDSSNRGEPR